MLSAQQIALFNVFCSRFFFVYNRLFFGVKLSMRVKQKKRKIVEQHQQH